MKQYKSSDKTMLKMTREGAVEVNAATGKKKRISKRIRDADFAKTEAPQPPEQAAQPLPGGTAPAPTADAPTLPHAPGAEREQDTAAAERVLERIDGARTRKASKKAARKAQAEATAKEKSSRLQFTDEERATPELEKYIRKSDKAADRLDAAKAAIPKEKKLVRERTFDEATGKGKTRLHFEEQEKPIGKNKPHNNPLSRPAQEAGIFVHNKIHSVEKDNSGVEGAHKSEELAERGAKYGARKVKEGYRSHKLKPYRAAAKAEKTAFKANVDFQYHKSLHDNPQIASNPLSRFMQKQQIKRQYAKAAKKGGAKTAQKAAENTRKAAKKTAEETKRAIAFVGRHPAGICIAVAALLLFIMVSAGLSSCGSMFSGLMNGILGTSYTSEDSDLVATENNYAAKENELQQQIDNIESTHPGYDEYRYDLDSIGHNPHELASYLTALLQTYTPQSAQAELNRVFAMQYTLTLTEETEIRYRTETSTDPETGETTTEEVPYEYHIRMNKKILRTLTALCAALMLTGGFSVTAFAQTPEGQDDTDDSGVVYEEPQKEEPLTPDGNATLVDDFGGNKQLITVTTKNGNYFYILIDRDDEGENTVHFLNQVDEADLLALKEDGSTEAAPPAVCSCTEKCEAGKVNVSCPVCKENMTACSGKEAEPETEEPPEQPKEKGSAGGLVLFLVVALLGGGGAFYYFKFMKPKQNVKGGTDLENFDFDDYDEDEPEPDEGDGLSDEEQEDEEE